MLVEHLDDLREVGQSTGQPVDLVDHHRIDPMSLDVGQEPLQGRPVDGSTRDSAVVVHLGQYDPTLMLLAKNKGFTGLALGVQRIEILLEALIGGFARIDRTADRGFRMRPLALCSLSHRSAHCSGYLSPLSRSDRRNEVPTSVRR